MKFLTEIFQNPCRDPGKGVTARYFRLVFLSRMSWTSNFDPLMNIKMNVVKDHQAGPSRENIQQEKYKASASSMSHDGRSE